MNCKNCGLPISHGAMGYVGPMCQCHWNRPNLIAATAEQMTWAEWEKLSLEEFKQLRAEIERLQAEVAKWDAQYDRDMAAMVGKLDVERTEAERLRAELAWCEINRRGFGELYLERGEQITLLRELYLERGEQITLLREALEKYRGQVNQYGVHSAADDLAATSPASDTE